MYMLLFLIVYAGIWIAEHGSFSLDLKQLLLYICLDLMVFGLLFYVHVLRMHRTKNDVERLHAGREDRQNRDMILAKKILNSELKAAVFDSEECRIEASVKPAKEVSGDFYDYYPLPDGKIVLCVSDVSGKGMSAAIFMMKAKTMLNQYFAHYSTIDKIIASFNDNLCINNAEMMYVTVWCGIYDPFTGDLDYICAGHNPPLIIRCNGEVEWVDCHRTFPVGIRSGRKFIAQRIHLNPGDDLFLYTDGITEAMNKKKALFGNDRLETALKNANRDSLIDSVSRDLNHFTGNAEQSDDITMLVLHVRKTCMNE